VSPLRVLRVVLATFGLASILAACGGTSVSDGPRQSAAAFAQAVADHQGAEACRALAPATRSELVQSQGESCAKAVLAVGLPDAGALERASVFGTMAEVGFAHDTLFVARFRFGWRVMAAGCKPVPGHPYDCDVQGG
jgi:hypothetical protein